MSLLILIWLCNFSIAQPNFPAPPGTIKFSSNLFIDKRPVTYSDYNEFIYFTKINKPDLVISLIPKDTLITYNNELLWNNPKFNAFPVVGLSIDQILLYCEWRSDMVNKLIAKPELRCSDLKYWKIFDALDPERIYKVNYSIPSMRGDQEYCRYLRKQKLDEVLMDGICSTKRRNKVKAFNKNNLFGFRCVAEYSLKN